MHFIKDLVTRGYSEKIWPLLLRGRSQGTLKNGQLFKKQTSSQPSPLFPPSSETDPRKRECCQAAWKQNTVGHSANGAVAGIWEEKDQELTEHFWLGLEGNRDGLEI